MNAIVFADYELESEPNKTVIGVDAQGNSLILEPNGAFSETDQRVLVTQVSVSLIDPIYVHDHLATSCILHPSVQLLTDVCA